MNHKELTAISYIAQELPIAELPPDSRKETAAQIAALIGEAAGEYLSRPENIREAERFINAAKNRPTSQK